jgi:hypothetical protein
MGKEYLRQEFTRLIYPEDLSTVMESYKLVTDAAFAIVSAQRSKQLKAVEDVDAGHLFQMTILKNLSIIKLAEPLDYQSLLGGFKMQNLYDPFALSSIVRTQYEAFCNFNNIYRFSKTPEEIKFKHNLWVLSGLNYRQSFPATQKETIQKKEAELKQIEELQVELRSSAIYSGLSVESKENFEKAIKWKKWQVVIRGEKASFIPWHEMLRNAGATDLLKGQYTSLSLNTHPSNVSVFQFESMYATKTDLPTTILTIKLSKWLISFMIADYCHYFAEAKAAFETLPVMTQIMINGYNSMFREEQYKINQISNILN